MGRQKGIRRSWKRLAPFSRKVRAEREEGEEESSPHSSSPQSSLRSLFVRSVSSKKTEGARGGGGASVFSEPTEGSCRNDDAQKAPDVRLDPTRTASWTSAALIIKSIDDNEHCEDAQGSCSSDDGDSSSLALSDLSVEEDSGNDLDECLEGGNEDARSLSTLTLLDSSTGCLDSSKQSLGGSSSCGCHVGSQSRGGSSGTSLASSIKSAIEGGWPALATDEDPGAKEEDETDEEDSVEARRIKCAIDSGWPGTTSAGGGSDGIKVAMDAGWSGAAAASTVITRRQGSKISIGTDNLEDNFVPLEVGGSQNDPRHPPIQAPPSSSLLGLGSSKWIIRAGGGKIKCDELEQATKSWNAGGARVAFDAAVSSQASVPVRRGPCAHSA